jgi:hypothetical protein
LTLRPRTDEEPRTIDRLAQSRTEPARLVEQARIIRRAHQGARARDRPRTRDHRGDGPALAEALQRGRDGRAQRCPTQRPPPVYDATEVGEVIAASLTKPDDLCLTFGSWMLDRLTAYLHEAKGLAIGRSRVATLLQQEGLCWWQQETWFGERPDPAFAERRAIVTLDEAPPPDHVVSCLDEMGPESANSFLGTELVRPDPTDQRPCGPHRRSTIGAAAAAPCAARSGQPPARR